MPFHLRTLNSRGPATLCFRICVRADWVLTSCLHPALVSWLNKRALFSKGQKRSRNARTYFRISRQKKTDVLGSLLGLAFRWKCYMRSAYCVRNASSHTLRKNPLSIWSWRRDLNPRPSDYKSDALPAELRQHKPPVTGHKVNKLAQRQSACNILNSDFFGES